MMYTYKLAVIGLFLLITGCAPKGPSEELISSNDCYKSTINSKLESIQQYLTPQDYEDLSKALARNYAMVSDHMLQKQRADDITDPLGGISAAAFNVDSSEKKAINSYKPIYMVLSRDTVNQKVSTYFQSQIKSSLSICYGI
ncbi:hypothetical protein [Aliivibrio fischeri]|uniref:hypothetical protein n=1 Tax=Aliivibrio fischeri TaxID=668 RepID=UPI00373537FB